jgi:hypothetical protein
MFIDPDNPLAAEILKEAGEAYFAGCKRMVTSLEALSAFDQAAGSSAQDDEQVRRRTQLLDEAAERVHCVVIQRDAMQLSGSETFLDDYGVPADVRARVGKPLRKNC